MTVKELKEIIADMPDDSPILIGHNGDYTMANVWTDEAYIKTSESELLFKADVFDVEDFSATVPRGTSKKTILVIDSMEE